MATYSVSAVFNKAASDIENYILSKSREMSIPMNIMPFILDKVRANISETQIEELSNITIELTNQLEDAKSKIPPEPKKEDVKEDN